MNDHVEVVYSWNSIKRTIIADVWTAGFQQSFIVAELLTAAVEQFHQVTPMTIAEKRMILANDHCGVRDSWS